MANVVDDVSNSREDSENSVDRSSRSSTAASTPREIHAAVSDWNNIRNPRVYRNKAKGVKDKGNSHSSMESDSRSPNIIFRQGTNSNGNQTNNHNEYNDDAHNNDNEVESEENHVGLMDQDVLAMCMMKLKSAQKALEREVEKLKNVGENDPLLLENSTDPSDSSNPSGYETRSIEELQSSEGSNIAEAQHHKDLKTELEEILKQRIEIEVQYIAISEAISRSKTVYILMQQQKKLELEQVEMMNKLESAENKAVELKRQSEKLEQTCEEILEKEQVWKLQSRVSRLTSCFIIELILFALVVYVFVSQFFPYNMGVVPT